MAPIDTPKFKMQQSMAERLKQYGRLMRLDKPIGAFLLLWPTLWALWLSSDGKPNPHVFTVLILGVFVMRAAGCVINDYADRDFDPHVARTRNRPIAAGLVGKTEALILFFLLGGVSLGLVLTLNTKTVLLALVAAVIAVTYPLMKRLTYFPQVYLGIAFTWGVPMAYMAHNEHVSFQGWWLFATGLLWVVAYDTYYAMVDRDDDLKIGIKSTAVLFGRWDRLIIGLIQIVVLVMLVYLGIMSRLGLWYYIGVGAAGLFAVYQQYITRNRQRDACFEAFLNNNWFGLMVFIGIILHYNFAVVTA